MPAYFFDCSKCGGRVRRIFSSEEVEKWEGKPCLNPQCDGTLHRKATAPSTQITETLDNGLMPRKLERLADAEQIFHDRAHGKKGVI